MRTTGKAAGLKDEMAGTVYYVDDFTEFVRANWERLGLTPVFLDLLVKEKGWWAELVEGCFGALVGRDYADIKMTSWVERLNARGYEFPIGKPVLEVLHEIMVEAWGGQVDELELPMHVFN